LGKITADEKGMHLLAYNLLRNLMWTSAELAQVPPMDFLQGTRQLLNHFIPTLAAATTTERLRLYRILLNVLCRPASPVSG